MTAMNYACNRQSTNCSTAAACSSARIFNRMDTALNLAVSIIVCRISLRLRILALT